MKGGGREVAGMRRVRTSDAEPSKQIGLIGAGVHVTAVEDFAHFNAATEQIFRTASMLEMAKYNPCAEPGAAVVMFLPKITEHPEP